MEVILQIIRQQPNSTPVVQSYNLQVDPGNTILDCLNRIKWEQDGTLAFRKNCRNTICGSCAMVINGRSALACKENVGSELARLRKIQKIFPVSLSTKHYQPHLCTTVSLLVQFHIKYYHEPIVAKYFLN